MCSLNQGLLSRKEKKKRTLLMPSPLEEKGLTQAALSNFLPAVGKQVKDSRRDPYIPSSPRKRPETPLATIPHSLSSTVLLRGGTTADHVGWEFPEGETLREAKKIKLKMKNKLETLDSPDTGSYRTGDSGKLEPPPAAMKGLCSGARHPKLALTFNKNVGETHA